MRRRANGCASSATAPQTRRRENTSARIRKTRSRASTETYPERSICRGAIPGARTRLWPWLLQLLLACGFARGLKMPVFYTILEGSLAERFNGTEDFELSIQSGSQFLLRLAWKFAGARPVISRRIQLEPDFIGAIFSDFAVGDAAARREAAADRLEEQVLVRLPKVFADDAGSVAAHINRGGNFKRTCCRIRQLHKHLESDAAFGAAQKGSVYEHEPAHLYF